MEALVSRFPAQGPQQDWVSPSPGLCVWAVSPVSPRTVILGGHMVLVAPGFPWRCHPELRAAHPGSFGEKRADFSFNQSWLLQEQGTEVPAWFLGGVRYCR